MAKKSVFISDSAAKTAEIARAMKLGGGSIVLLEGDLGAGKTVFAAGIAQGLGVLDAVTSPTFTILNSYEGCGIKLHHIDAYRLEGKETAEIGLEDYIGSEDAVTVVEWHRFIEHLIPRYDALVRIEMCGEGRRKIEIWLYGEN